MGKWLGLLFGFAVGQIPGALIGFWVGMRFDSALARQSSGTQNQADLSLFVKSTFLIMGYVAKSTGRISEDDIEVARRMMRELQLTPFQSQQAMRDFNQGKQPDFLWYLTVQDLAAKLPILLRKQWLQIQLRAAMASGMTPNKYRCLERIAVELGLPLPHATEAPPPSSAPADDLPKAYQTLGVSPDATDDQVKRAYRKLMQRYHPDRAVGATAAALEIAKEKTQRIQAAYQAIKKIRGL